jgi:hypothetical protein
MLNSRNAWFRVAYVLLVIGIAFLVIPPYKQYCENQYASQYYCATYEVTTFLGTFLDAHGAAINTLATIFIAAFTATLWVSTHLLWKAGRDQIKLAREEFIATHRPRVIVRFIQGPFHENGVYDEFVWVTIANIGETKATIIELGCDLARRTDRNAWVYPGLQAAPKPISPIFLESGARHTFKVRAHIPEAMIFTHADYELCVVGCIRYKDDNGRRLETGFLRINSGPEGFLPSKNPEDDYQD